MVIVTFEYGPFEPESEREFTTLLDATEFADGVIEEGGRADCTVYCDTLDKEAAVHAMQKTALCCIYIERE